MNKCDFLISANILCPQESKTRFCNGHSDLRCPQCSFPATRYCVCGELTCGDCECILKPKKKKKSKNEGLFAEVGHFEMDRPDQAINRLGRDPGEIIFPRFIVNQQAAVADDWDGDI